MNYTYIVRCSDGTLYTGWTNDLKKRIKDHNEGRGQSIPEPAGQWCWHTMRSLTQRRKL